MSGQQKFRFVCITLLWLALCYLFVSSQPLTLRVVLIIVTSGIVVFVPLYKKYIRNGKKAGNNGKRR